MGILSTLAKIGGIAAAPFTGGASMALTALGGVGDVLGKQQQGAAQGQATQAQLTQGQDRNAIDLYGSQQGAQNSAAQLDLQRKGYDATSRSAAGKQALLAMLLGDYKPSQVSVPGVTNATFSGGMGDTIKNNPQILELLKSIAAKGVTDQATPNTFTGGNLITAPKLTPLPQKSKTSSIMDTIAKIAQIGGSLGAGMGGRLMPFNLSGGFSAGAGADALEDLLKRVFIQQSERRRAKQEDQRINIDAERTRQGAEMQRAQLASMDEARKAAAQDREERTVQAMLEATAPDTNIDPALAGRVRAAGLGGMVPHTAADLPSTAISGGAQAGAAAPIMGSLRMAQAGRPARDTFTGTAGQIQVRQAAQDRAAQIAQAAQDKKEAAALAAQQRTDAATAAQQGREDLARLTAGLHGSNADLQRELLQGKIDAAQEKSGEKRQAVDTARNAAVASIDDTSSALDELIDAQGNLKPGVSGAFGLDAVRSRIPGTSAANAKARVDRLQSRLTIDLLGEMKRQSRTGASGFGALSERELTVLENAAARLGASQSDESARQALVDVRKQLSGMRQRAAGATQTAPQADGGQSAIDILNSRRKQ